MSGRGGPRDPGRPDTGPTLCGDAPYGASAVARALLVREPWAGLIARGVKSWEIRSRGTAIRGPIAIAAAGTGQLVAICRLVAVEGPLTVERYVDAWRLWGGAEPPCVGLPYPATYAWVLADACALPEPVSYRHPPGAVTWVRLDPTVWRRVEAAREALRQRGCG